MKSNVLSEALEYLSKDEKLAPIVNEKMLKFDNPSYDVYEGLLKSIVSQQLSVKAAATIYERFVNLFESKYPDHDILLQLDKKTLRSVGLSNQKSGYVQNVANYFTQHNLFNENWSQHADSEIINVLTSIKGVGEWTVQMILMFTLGRLDVMPLGDLGIQHAMIDIYNLTTTKKELKEEMHYISKSWSPYRTIACRYLWRYKDSPTVTP